MQDMCERLAIKVNESTVVSAILQLPSAATSCFVFAHGAGAGMEHPFMAAVASGLEALGMATLRYQFPYMERHSGRPDRPPLCYETIRAAVAKATDLLPNLPLIAGGKSFGGRMTSQAFANSALANVLGLCFFGFPLHAPKAPSSARADHLSAVRVPMLFFQGTRDAMADMGLMQSVVARLDTAVIVQVENADHGFHVPVRSGRTDAQVMQKMLEHFVHWAAQLGPNAAENAPAAAVNRQV